MKKILTTIAALACAVQAWGKTVSYVDESGVTQSADATVIVASGSGIYVADNVILKAGASENPTELIPHAALRRTLPLRWLARGM